MILFFIIFYITKDVKGKLVLNTLSTIIGNLSNNVNISETTTIKSITTTTLLNGASSFNNHLHSHSWYSRYKNRNPWYNYGSYNDGGHWKYNNTNKSWTYILNNNNSENKNDLKSSTESQQNCTEPSSKKTEKLTTTSLKSSIITLFQSTSSRSPEFTTTTTKKLLLESTTTRRHKPKKNKKKQKFQIYKYFYDIINMLSFKSIHQIFYSIKFNQTTISKIYLTR